MVPSVFVELNELPLTPNGKVDRGKLPEPGSHRPTLEASYVSPRNGVERTISAVWQDVLKLEQVGIHDNFFDLGGNSLLVVQVQNGLRNRLNREIPLLDFFQRPTVSGLAEKLAEKSPRRQSFSKIKDRAKRQKEALGDG